jgi:hypothetical protein
MSKALAVILKLDDEKARWKRAKVRRSVDTPALKALVYKPFGKAV